MASSVDTSTPPQSAALPLRVAVATVSPPLLVVLGMAVATHSVVRYKLWIVAVYTVLAVLLAIWVLRSDRPAGPVDPAGPVATAGGAVVDGPVLASGAGRLAGRGAGEILVWSLVATFALVAVLQLTVRPYTYLTMSQGWLVRAVYAAAAVLVALGILAAALTGRRRLADAGLAAAVLGYLIAAVLLIHFDPAPKIDVWVMLQQTADGLLHGKNMYTQNWSGSPGVQDAFTYLPFMGLLLAPGRWFAGDVRWMLVVVTLLGALAVRLLAQSGRRADRTQVQMLASVAAAALLLVLPGTATQVEQAWTEPLLMACLAGWALGVQRRNTVLAVVCLALGVASKQHLVLLLPVLAAWPRFGLRKAIYAGALGGLFVLPWIIASPKDIWHDAVTVLINFQPLIFADTLYIAAVNNLSWTPPFWLTGAAVLITLGAAVVQVHRRNPDLGTVLRWAALFLFVANLVNKQAFYNQYWLVAAIVVISLAVPRPDPIEGETGGGAAEARIEDAVSDPQPVRPPAGAEA